MILWEWKRERIWEIYAGNPVRWPDALLDSGCLFQSSVLKKEEEEEATTTT